jgi:hypothetical protein
MASRRKPIATKDKRRKGPTRLVRRPADAIKVASDAAAKIGAAKLTAALPALALIAAAIPAVVAYAVSGALALCLQLVQDWWRRLCEESGKSFDEVKADYEWQAANDPNAARVVFDSVQGLITANPVAMPAIAALGHEYFEKPLDRFFRDSLHLLCDLSAGEFHALRKLLGIILSLEITTTDASIMLDCFPVDRDARPRFDPALARELSYVRPSRTPEEMKKGKNVREAIGTYIPEALTLFQLMKRHGLAGDARSGGFGAVTGPEVAVLISEDIRHLHRIVK